MKNKSKILGKIGVILLYAVAVLYTAVFAISLYKDFWSILLLVLGSALCYIFCAFLHEGGHIISAKLLGFKVVGFSVGFIKFDYSFGKKVSFGSSDYAGETDVIPIRGGNLLRRYKAVIFGGIAGGVLSSIIISALYFVFAFNQHIAILFASFPVSIAWVIINTAPRLIISSDGSSLRAFEEEKNSIPMENYLNVLYLLNEGKSFSQIDEKFFALPEESSIIYEELLVAKLMRAEETEDEKETVEAVERLKSIEDRLADTDKELLVSLALKGDEEGVEALKYVLPLCDGESDLRSMRTLIAYAHVKGDEKYVKIAKESALKRAKEWRIKGEGKFTEMILKRF